MNYAGFSQTLCNLSKDIHHPVLLIHAVWIRVVVVVLASVQCVCINAVEKQIVWHSVWPLLISDLAAEQHFIGMPTYHESWRDWVARLTDINISMKCPPSANKNRRQKKKKFKSLSEHIDIYHWIEMYIYIYVVLDRAAGHGTHRIHPFRSFTYFRHFKMRTWAETISANAAGSQQHTKEHMWKTERQRSKQNTQTKNKTLEKVLLFGLKLKLRLKLKHVECWVLYVAV